MCSLLLLKEAQALEQLLQTDDAGSSKCGDCDEPRGEAACTRPSCCELALETRPGAVRLSMRGEEEAWRSGLLAEVLLKPAMSEARSSSRTRDWS